MNGEKRELIILQIESVRQRAKEEEEEEEEEEEKKERFNLASGKFISGKLPSSLLFLFISLGDWQNVYTLDFSLCKGVGFLLCEI